VETARNHADVTWIGCNTRKHLHTPSPALEKTGVKIRELVLSNIDLEKFYYKSSKEGFWPVLHSSLENYQANSIDWDQFVAINLKFATAAIKEASTKKTLIWIHDYNLWLAPLFIREKLPNARISFFFHTPFPSPDIFNILPWRKDIIKSLLNCDIIGFSIPRYIENFVNTASSVLDLEILETKDVNKPNAEFHKTALYQKSFTTKIRLKTREITFDVFPVGVSNQRIKKMLTDQKTVSDINSLKKKYRNQKIILSVSRTDYIKGTLELLVAYRKILQNNPKFICTVSLILISVKPSPGITAYDEYLHKVENLVNEIQKEYSTKKWKPIIFSEENYSFDKILTLYSIADILIVPSLRDGMNLVAKEYISVHKGKTGNIVLSEFAGASIELKDAILINPYHPDSIYQGIHQALEENENDRSNRIKKLYAEVLNSDVAKWGEQLLRLLPKSPKNDLL
jgi:glucosylglycerol-phosphate synthase